MIKIVGTLKHLRKLVQRRAAPGSSPGTLAFDPTETSTVIRAMAYGPDGFVERSLDSIEEIDELMAAWPVVWIDVDGLGQTETLAALAQKVAMHPLALEDAVNRQQRPKVERYGDRAFVVVQMVSHAARLETEQLSIFFTDRIVLTLQGTRPGDCLDPIRERLRGGRGQIRTGGASYLAYALVDAVVDHYFPVLDSLGARLEELESGVLAGELRDAPTLIHAAKHDLRSARRLILPLRDAVRRLSRDEDLGVPPEVRQYFRDCHDHTLQLAEVMDSYSDVAASLLDIHFSTLSNRMNEIMKLLTLVATLFIPLTFIAGIYGMNFDPGSSPFNMPETRWYFGYPFCLGLMAATAVGLLLYYRSRGWLR